MTKARFKALLAVVVALSLFVCTAAVGWSYTFSFPSFSSVSFFGVYPGGYRQVDSVSVSGSDAPFTFYSYSDFSSSDSFSGFDFYLYGSSYPPSYTWDGFTSGYYTACVELSSSSPLPSLSDFNINVFLDSSLNCVVSSSYYVLSTPRLAYIYFSYEVPPSSTDFRFLFFSLRFSSSFLLDSISFHPSFFPNQTVLPVLPTYPASNTAGDIFSEFANGKFTAATNNSLFWLYMSLAESNNKSSRYLADSFRYDFLSFSSKVLPAINNLTSYFISQSGKQDNDMSAAVPDDLKQQQQEAQNHLTDYENKEQAVFDNLNTSLDDLNLDQYTTFSPSILSSMSFVNRYVTAGFDGLVDFKIILFLPMVIGIGLSVIGRMNSMLSRMEVRDRRDAA